MGSEQRLNPRGRDLDDELEVSEVVRRFHADVAKDDRLGPPFNYVAQVDWFERLRKLTAFWCRILLSQPGYRGNPLRGHVEVHERRVFTRADFERWLDLVHEHVDIGWAGAKAEQAKAFARRVARVHSHQLGGTTVDHRPAGEPTDVTVENESPRQSA